MDHWTWSETRDPPHADVNPGVTSRTRTTHGDIFRSWRIFELSEHPFLASPLPIYIINLQTYTVYIHIIYIHICILLSSPSPKSSVPRPRNRNKKESEVLNLHGIMGSLWYHGYTIHVNRGLTLSTASLVISYFGFCLSDDMKQIINVIASRKVSHWCGNTP